MMVFYSHTLEICIPKPCFTDRALNLTFYFEAISSFSVWEEWGRENILFLKRASPGSLNF